MMLNKFNKKFLIIILIFFGICISIVGFARWRVIYVSDGLILDNNELMQINTQECKTIVLLGAGVLADGSMNSILEERAITVKNLYEQINVCEIIVTGNEVEVYAVREYFVGENIPLDIIKIDGAGIDTFNSMTNIHDIFKVNDVIVVTHDFHLQRAIYIARILGLDAYGYEAYEYYPYAILEKPKYIIRDWLASVKAVWEVELSNIF